MGSMDSVEDENKILYQIFLESFWGSFLEFVQSDEVNAYLQTIGGDIFTRVVQDGYIHDIIVVTGYEEARGNWATSYDSKIRFGEELIQVQGLKDPMVLTPNFFYGKNMGGEDVEYRMGLVKGIKLHVHPVILRKVGKKILARTLPDLCVIHRGISIDPDSAEQLNKVEMAKVTINQQFLSCFWNIDDYLRKQNPHYASDFDMEIWKAVEVFSGRIVDQMLGTIASLKSEKWIIPQAEEYYQSSLMSRIMSCLENENHISINQLVYLLKNLCSFMIRFKKYESLECLLEIDSKVVFYLLKAHQVADREGQKEVLNTLEKSLKILQERILANPKIVIRENLSDFFLELEILDDSDFSKNFSQMDTLCHIVRLLIEKRSIHNIIKLLHSRNTAEVFETLNVILRRGSHLIDQASQVELFEQISQLLPIKLDQSHFNNKFHAEIKSARINDLAATVCATIIKNNPNLINQEQIREMIRKTYGLGSGFLKLFFTIILKNTPFRDLFNQEQFHELLKKTFSLGSGFLEFIKIVLKNSPHQINQTTIGLIKNNFEHKNVGLREASIKAYVLIFETIPELFSTNFHDALRVVGTFLYRERRHNFTFQVLEDFKRALNSIVPKHFKRQTYDEIINLMSSEESIWRFNSVFRDLILRTFELIALFKPHFISQQGFNKVLDSISISPIKALELYSMIIKRMPQFISPESIDIIYPFTTSSIKRVRILARKVIKDILNENPHVSTENSSHPLMQGYYYLKNSNLFVLFRILFEIEVGIVPRSFFSNVQNKKSCKTAKQVSLRVVGKKINLKSLYSKTSLEFDLINIPLIAGDVFYVFLRDFGSIPLQVCSTIPKGRVRLVQGTVIRISQ